MSAAGERAIDALGEGGAFASVEGFRVRPAQQELAAAIADCIVDRDTLVAEAGTGTGKTYAYLVPALQSGRRVIVSTGTKTLQDQLFHRDLPRVRAVLGVRMRAALLKGRANYLCLQRMDTAQRDGRLASRQAVVELSEIASWARRTLSGDISELDRVPEDSTIWPLVTSTPENCLGSECPQFDDCFVVRARRDAQAADLVVVNHHLLFADLAIKREGFGEILPGAHAFVLDEAHQIPELAGQFFSESVSARQLNELANDCLLETANVPGSRALLQAPCQALELALKQARLAMEGAPQRGRWATLKELDGVADTLAAVVARIEELAATLEPLRESSKGMDSCASRAELVIARLDNIEDSERKRHVVWYELTTRGFSIHSTPLDVAGPLRDFREQTGAAWIFTSATLSVNGSFDHFARQTGLDEPRSVLLESPFDFARNALLYLPRGLPDPQARDYTERVVEAIRPVLESSRGRAFLLFTSHRALRLAADLLADLEWPLFVQGTAPRAQLLERFREAGNGVLLGAASFWEGVDVQGEALSLVVIDKLPFAAPDDPVLEARIQVLREAGGNPFAQIQIPAAVIALKQGVGRLIRAVDDRGVLMLCDPRLVNRGYGKVFLNSLPPAPRTRELGDVQQFFGELDV